MTETELNSLYQYAMTLAQDRDDAYDLLQQALEKLLDGRADKNMTQAAKMHWLRRVIRNQFIDAYRKHQRFPAQSYEEHSNYDISPLDLEQLHIQQDELHKLWPELHAIDRDILYHWAVLGYSTDEACALLNIKRGSFLSRMHRLRKFWQKRQLEEGRN
ncbi:RNA polymerase sigma factor [Agaribacterium haliotis]|uniref:RNA polymerase sigma factor n=1 Tax=Agaribacterium haliotis TaxID=2013869 RepID=UPI000BB568C3|nr:sigma-70 family RNA polymerase sigma factor [Agaribacterium haliotis]